MIAEQKKLAEILSLNLRDLAESENFSDFPLCVPESFVGRMEKNNSADPLLLQVLPQACEGHKNLKFTKDPLCEKNSSPLPGLIHKYYGRVLLLVTDACPINCRFCFRRYSRDKISDFGRVFSYIENDTTLTEVILSGGDPLMLHAHELKNIIEIFAKIPHVKRLRIHSRMPIVQPGKIRAEIFRDAKLPIILVVHCNHPNEIDESVMQCISALRRENITIFNQSVLLRGINDNAETLITLCEKLFNAGILPYYLHMLDRVAGSMHFFVSKKKAKEIYAEMQRKLPGYLVPKLVRDESGAPAKKLC